MGRVKSMESKNTKTLFEVSFVVDARRLGEALAALEGKAYNVQHKIVKRETEAKEPEPQAVVADSEGTSAERIIAVFEKLRDKGVKELDTKQISQLARTHLNYTSTILTRLTDEKVLKRVGLGRYQLR